MKQKGFTLVELLAVIVILAIILAIAIPAITGITTKAKQDAFEANVKLLIKGIQYYQLQYPAFDITTISQTNLSTYVSGVNNADYAAVVVTNPSNVVTVQVKTTSTSKFGQYQTVTTSGGSTYGTATYASVYSSTY